MGRSRGFPGLPHNEDAFPAGSGSRTWYFDADPAAFDMMVSGDPNTMFDIGRVQ